MTPVEATLLLTILSVLGLWTLLGVLILGLYFILKPLQGIRGYLEKVAMGVRAIEQQTVALREQPAQVREALGRAEAALASLAEPLEETGRALEAALPALRGR